MQDWLLPRVQRFRTLSADRFTAPASITFDNLPGSLADTFPVTQLHQRNSDANPWLITFEHDPEATYLTADLETFQRDESYRLTLRTDGATIEHTTDLGAFRALTTLLQICTRSDDLAWRRWRGARIVDYPELEYRGLMYDLARDNLYRHQHMQELLHTAVQLKYTHVTLYLEERFRWPSLPPFANNENFISPEQASELDTWAKQHFLTLVPQTNCIGHNEGFVGLEIFSDISEDRLYGAQLRTGHMPSLRHVGQRYAELTRSFSTPILHVGGDEARELGQRPESESFGRQQGDASQFAGGKRGQGAIYLRHINAVYRIVHKLGRDMAVWGDMIKNHPEIADHIPKQTIIHDWIYNETNRASLQQFQNRGHRVIASATDSGAFHIGPDLERAQKNIEMLFGDAIDLKLLGGEMTVWEMQLGHSFPLTLYPILYAGHFMWSGKPIERRDFISPMTAQLFGSDTHTFGQLCESLLVDANQALRQAFTNASAISLHDYTDEWRYQSWRKAVIGFTAEIPEKQTPVYHLISLITSPMYDPDLFRPVKEHVQIAVKQLAAIRRTARRNENLLAGYELLCQIYLFNLWLLERLPVVEKHYHRAAIAQAQGDETWHDKLSPLTKLLDEIIEQYRDLIRLQKPLVKQFGHPQADLDTLEKHIDLTRTFKQKVQALKQSKQPLQNFHRFLLEYPSRHF